MEKGRKNELSKVVYVHNGMLYRAVKFYALFWLTFMLILLEIWDMNIIYAMYCFPAAGVLSIAYNVRL